MVFMINIASCLLGARGSYLSLVQILPLSVEHFLQQLKI